MKRTLKNTPCSFLKLRAESRRISIRPVRLSDFKAVRESRWGRLPKANPFDDEIPVAKEASREEFKKAVERYKRIGEDGHHFVFGVFSKRSGAFLGQVDIFTINRQLRWGNLGYHIQNQYWGKGYAVEAGRLALKLAFGPLGFHRMEAAMELKNKASARVAQKLGMEYEGKREKFFPDNGGIDMYVYAANAIDY